MNFLNEKHHKAILLLTAGRSTKEVSAELGVTQRCVELWAKDPDFHRLLSDSLNKCLQESLSELSLHTQSSIFKLKTIIDDPDTPTRLVLQAIQILLSHSLKHSDRISETKLEALNTEEILDYFIKTGSSDQVFKALEFRRKNEELVFKQKGKIELQQLEQSVQEIAVIAQKYIPHEMIPAFVDDLETVLSQTGRQATY
ncbi:MAG: hypothetical protein ACR2LR_08380 [Hassallia sp.]|jgi:hypothetical protein